MTEQLEQPLDAWGDQESALSKARRGELVREQDDRVYPSKPEFEMPKPAPLATAIRPEAGLAEVDEAIARRERERAAAERQVLELDRKLAAPPASRIRQLLGGSKGPDRQALVDERAALEADVERLESEVAELRSARWPYVLQEAVFVYDTEVRPKLRKVRRELRAHLQAAADTFVAYRGLLDDAERRWATALGHSILAARQGHPDLPSVDSRDLNVVNAWRSVFVGRTSRFARWIEEADRIEEADGQQRGK